MSITRPARRRSRVVAGAVTVVLSGALTGCTGLQPGAAVRVGDTTISMERVDDLAAGFCKAIEPQLGQGGLPAVIAMGDLRRGVAQSLASREIAQRIADDFGVEPTSDYASAVRTLESQAEGLPEAGRSAFLDVQRDSAYVQNVIAEAARRDLVDSGTSSPTQEEISAHAEELFAQYRASSEVSFDPRLGLSSSFEREDGSLSVAVSKLATSGEDAADPASLPAAQRCGG